MAVDHVEPDVTRRDAAFEMSLLLITAGGSVGLAVTVVDWSVTAAEAVLSVIGLVVALTVAGIWNQISSHRD